MGATKQLLIDSSMVCPICGHNHDCGDDIISIRLFGACRACCVQAEAEEYYS